MPSLISFQVYPGRDITNIVESSHYQKIGGWCRQDALNSNKCKGAPRWVKPFRCLGKFSDVSPSLFHQIAHFVASFSLFPKYLLKSFARRRTIPVGRAAGARGLLVRSHPQCVQVLAVREVESDWRPGLSGSRNANAELRHAVAVRHLPLLRRRVRVLS